MKSFLSDPLRRELRYLQRTYSDLYPKPRRRIRNFRPWDVPLLEHYLYTKARTLGRNAKYRDHAWPPKDPKPVWDEYWEEVAKYLEPNQVIAELGPGDGYFTDRFIADCRKAYLVDYSELLCFQLLPDKYGNHPNVTIIHSTDCRMPEIAAGEVDLLFSLAAFVHIDIETIYGYLLEAHRIVRPQGKVVIQYASMVGEEAFNWFAKQCPRDYSSHALRCQHPDTLASISERVGFQVVDNVVEKCNFNSFIHLLKP